jgi:hypothetical protein
MALRILKPHRITIHTPKSLSGSWIDLLLTSSPAIIDIDIIDEKISSKCSHIKHYAHKSDFLRLYFLYQVGGIYLDIDVFPYKALTDLLTSSLPILGKQAERGLCNAVILAPAKAEFVEIWLNTYTQFDNAQWDYHSVILPAILKAQHPENLITLPSSAFFEPQWHNQLREILVTGMPFASEGYCCHLWHTICKSVLQTITPMFILDTPCFYSNIVKSVVSESEMVNWKVIYSCN